jgi:hypothetical protein
MLIELQETIGARQFFEGWTHHEWEKLQEQYYSGIKSRRSSKRWATALITKLWNVAWDLWEFRNGVFHQKLNHSQLEDTNALDVKVRDISHKLNQTGLLPKDRHLMSISITRLLLLPRIQKVEWLNQATLALAHVKKRQFQIR